MALVMERICEKNKHTACTSQHIAIDAVDKLKQMHGSALYEQYARVMRYVLNLGALCELQVPEAEKDVQQLL